MTTPPEFGVAYERAHDWPAFSNSTEGMAWTGAWCGTCTHGEGGDGCALVDVALVGRTPAEWTLEDRGSLLGRYDCAVYDPNRPGRDVREHLATSTAPNPPAVDHG